MELTDEQWSSLRGLYGSGYDPRAALRKLESGVDVQSAWNEFWAELHHQGDICEAAYATIPVVARLVAEGKLTGWEPYALAQLIEEARRENPRNPQVPPWLAEEYAAGWRLLFASALAALPSATDESLVSSVMALLAMHKGLRMLSRLAILTEAERESMLDEVGWA